MSIKSFITSYLDTGFQLVDDDIPEPSMYGICSRDFINLVCELQEFYANWAEDWILGDWRDDQAGHDLFLTRNGHGVGFWDRQFNELSTEIGERLSEAAKEMGMQGFYLGDDNIVYSTR